MPPLSIGERIWIIGPPGAGKSTLGRFIHKQFGIEYYELDRLFWGPNWTKTEKDEFRSSVQQITDTERWVIDGQYPSIHDILVQRVDTILWLDIPFRVVLYRILKRTFRRLFLREALWNGNRENFRNAMGFFSYVFDAYPQVVKMNDELFGKLTGHGVTLIHVHANDEIDVSRLVSKGMSAH